VVVAAFKAKSQHLVLAPELVSLPVTDTIDRSLKFHLFRVLSSPNSVFNTETRLFRDSFNGP